MEARDHAAAEQAARAAYGRLLAQVARRTRDIAAAEDALADAFHAALERWPRHGAPERPEAWLLTVARRLHGRARARSAVAARAVDTIRLISQRTADRGGAGLGVDRRLELLFVCAHPAIDVAVRTPLMLQVVLGLDAARIASAFLVAPAAMGQRLVRAKAKIRDAGIAFEEPEAQDLDPRLHAVLDAIYAAYGAGWDDLGAGGSQRGLAQEALYLARLVAHLRPQEPEAGGLLALILYCEARADARRDGQGAYVPLDAQDVSLWLRPMISEAEAVLRKAAQSARPGRYQTEAAIQSLHVDARLTGVPPSGALACLYDLLVTLTPALGARIARACVYGAADASAGLRLLEELERARVCDHQPYWATRAHLERAAGLDASASFARAAGLSADPAVRLSLQRAAATARQSACAGIPNGKTWR